MGLKQSIIQIHTALEEAGIGHALIGGFALAVHGINRATGDIDLLVDENNKTALTGKMAALGYSLRIDTGEVMHFTGSSRIDVLLARRPVSRRMLADAMPMPPLGIKCLGPEDLIGLKIQAYCNNRKREFQDKADIVFLLQKYPDMDFDKIKSYADVFKEWDEIQNLRNRV
ncbi:MAG: hypothetical protein A2583_02160 [Bdellovibrionales bacterium RIFOXYD1_FULL_53_11]|nr:MAG: hypothetical protein A2583_02160 [Bdellovibrionales bacterium RIFOXYD1_FULL_53_11]